MPEAVDENGCQIFLSSTSPNIKIVNYCQFQSAGQHKVFPKSFHPQATTVAPEAVEGHVR